MADPADFAARFTVYWQQPSVDAVDRIVLREDGLATSRISYFDSSALVRAAVLRPRAWPALLRLRRAA